MDLIPLYGHDALRDRLVASRRRGALPASLLLQGPRGVGKQRLALWLGQLLLCESDDAPPCGRCQDCRFAGRLAHPDLHWYFPRPRPKDPDPSPQDVARDLAEAAAERLAAGGLYEAPSGTEGIFVASVRAIVQQASLRPALGRRKVFVVGDAERMVSQEGADQAANAFLKLLEEPPAHATIILTSSEPGALLPTIRSRVVCVRVGPLPEDDVRAFLADPRVVAAVSRTGSSADAERVVACGAPGELFGGGSTAASTGAATRVLDAALADDRGGSARVALAQGIAGARGAFSDMLDALTVLLHARARDAVARGDERQATAASRAVPLVERAKGRAAGNVNPQLVTSALLRQLGGVMR